MANTFIPENRENLVSFACENSIELVQDPYGNYAVQEIMNKWPEQNFEPLIAKVKSKVAQLSIQKFSSNVVEKCLQMSDVEQRNDIIIHIANVDKLVSVMRNSYGNYVVQKALNYATGEAKMALADAIYQSIPNIQDKKIRVKWAQILYHSIQNDLNFAEKYDIEEYLDDISVTSDTSSNLMRGSSTNDPNYEIPLESPQTQLSPSRMGMMQNVQCLQSHPDPSQRE